ncbi:MAG: AI-2E family transporter [Chitinophagaceae bacterium]
MKTETKLPFYAAASLVSVGLFAFLAILFLAQKIIVPIIYSTIIAIVLGPVVSFFVRRGIGRIMSITITLFIVIITTIVIAVLLSAQMMQFTNSFPKLIEQFHFLIDQLSVWVSGHFHISLNNLNVWVAKKNAEIANEASVFIAQTIINTGSLLVVVILSLVYVFMILYYQPLLLEFIHKIFKSNKLTDINEMLIETRTIIRSYLTGLLLEAAIIATLNSTTLLIIGLDYAILLGVISAILNVIPFIGGLLAVSLPMLIAITTKSPSYAFLVLVAYLVIQFIDNHYIIPKIVASRVKLNALISVVVVLIGGALWGIAGMFLSIPLTAIIKLIFDRIEALKPWGYLLGDTMPAIITIKSPFRKKVTTKPVQPTK